MPILFIISCSELVRCAKQIRIDLASQALRELSREQHDDLERPMVQANALDKSGFVAREDCGAPDILTKSFAFPLEIRLKTIYRLIGKDQRFVYADRGRGEEGLNRFYSDARPIQH
jgi:hypothetical protein